MSSSSKPGKLRKLFDWTRDPPPGELTAHQRFIRDVDWTKSPLGPMDRWPDQLRQMVLAIVADPDPAVIYWGDSQAIVYNEAYIPLIGAKHPGLQGQDPRIGGFAEIWEPFDRILLEGEDTGVTHCDIDQLVLILRNGYLEEGYFSYKFVPLIGPQGFVIGNWATVGETTRERIYDRRSTQLQFFNDQLGDASDLKSLWKDVISGLGHEGFDKDIPVAMVYVDSTLQDIDSSPSNEATQIGGKTYHLEGQTGFSAGHACAPRILTSSDASHPLYSAFNEAQVSRAPVILSPENGRLPEDFFSKGDRDHDSAIERDVTHSFRGFGVPSTEVAIYPLVTGDDVHAFAVFGLNPRKRYDLDYEVFLTRLANQKITNRLSAVLLSMEKERSELQAYEAALAKSMHERQRQEEMKFIRFAERVQVGLCVVNLSGQIVYANHPWYDFSGISQDVKGMSWMDAVLEDDRATLKEAWEKITREGISWAFEFRTQVPLTGTTRNPHMMAEHRTGLCVAYPDFADDGTVASVMGITVDISETKYNERVTIEKMEEAVALRKRQEAFIDMISHEIRNPMSAVLNCTEEILEIVQPMAIEQALERTQADPTRTKNADTPMINVLEASRTILYCIEHQKRIVDDVLSLSKLDSGLVELVPCPVQVMKTVHQVVGIFEQEIKALDITLSVIEDASLAELDLKWAMLDSNRFLQILINLVTNSIKFTRGRETRNITVNVRASLNAPSSGDTNIVYLPQKTTEVDSTDQETNNKDDVYLSCSVSDTGKGLTDNDHDVLFNRFAQSSPKTYIEYGGSGLGLFISRHITELMGGQIGVSRGQSLGSTFSFFIKTRRVPRDQVIPESFDKMKFGLDIGNAGSIGASSILDAPPAPPPASSAPKREPEMRRKIDKLLVVEDNKINQRVLCKNLAKRGYAVEAANHGQEALDSLLQARSKQVDGVAYFDLVLCDIEMPVLDGIGCVQTIRKYEREGLLPGHIPVIAVSANARREHMQRAEEAGMVNSCSPHAELIAQLQRVLEHSEEIAMTPGSATRIFFAGLLSQHAICSSPTRRKANLSSSPNITKPSPESRWPSGLHLAVDYYPSQWPEWMWELDISRMRDSNVSYVRISEFDWSVLEPTEDAYNFTLLDKTLALFQKYGIRAIIGTPTASPPNWANEKYNIDFVDRTNTTLLFGSRRAYSFSSFDYRRLSKKIVRVLGERYGKNENVVGWQLDNEFGCHDTVRSYDRDAKIRFRTWLRKKYGTIENMNEVQGRVFWSSQYMDFESVEPPFLEVYTNNEAHTLDWYRFSSDMVIEFAKEQADILKELAPTHAITTNFMVLFTDFDHYRFNQEVGIDIATFDSYPLAGTGAVPLSEKEMTDFLRTGLPDLQALVHGLYRGISGMAYGTTSGPFGVMEMQPGVLNWNQYRVSPLEGMVRLWTHETFAASGDLVSYFRWRQVPYAQEQTLSGLFTSDNSEDQGYVESQVFAQEDLPRLKEQDIVDAGQADVALIFDYTSQWVWAIEPYSGSWSVKDAEYTNSGLSCTDLVYTFYSSLRRLGLSIDVISPEQSLDGYKMVVVPSLPIIPEAFDKSLSAFNGTVVFGPHSASHTKDFAYTPGLAPSNGSIRERLPMRVTRVETPPSYAGSGVEYAGTKYSISGWEEWISCSRNDSSSNATIVYTSPYRPGKPAACSSGDMHYLAFNPPADLLVSYLGDVARGLGLRDVVGRVVGKENDLGGTLRLARRGDLLWAINYGWEAQRVPVVDGTLVIGEAGDVPGAGVLVWKLNV
ncbi:hypothetical protein FKW77_007979 [Venturia effusa]|uniref:beta-galactosidase n=1 Tax=Venturia effusa TaxID=50376 RepID=A0A517LKK3_9PEZI|nr:hypothetical protein FKW77_007979 [Venturia effusa]